MTRFARRLVRVAGALAVAILFGVAALHHPAIRARVLDRARAYVESEFHVALRATGLSYNLFTRSLELKDVSIASTAAAEPFLQADRIAVVFHRGLWLGQPAVARVSLSRPRVTLVRERDGTMNLPASRKSTEPSSPMHLGLVSVTALTVRVDDRVTERSFTAGPFDLSVDTSGAPRRFGAFGPHAFTARAGQKEMSGTVAGRLAFDGARVSVEDLAVETREGRLTLAGGLAVTGERPDVSLRIAAMIDLARAARLARAEELAASGLAGRLEGTIDVTGALASPDIALMLDVDSAAGSLHVQGRIDVTGAAGRERPSRVALRWSDVRIDDLVHAIGYSPPVHSGSLASGSATIHFDALERGAPALSRLRAAATTTFQPAPDASRPEVLAVTGRADLTLDEGHWSLRHAIRTRDARAGLTGEITGQVAAESPTRSTLEGRTRLSVVHVGGLTPLLRAAGVTIPAGAVDGLGGSMVADLDLAGTTDSPRAGIDLAARDVRTRQWPHPAAVSARLDVDGNGLRARAVSAHARTTSLQVTGRYSWSGRFDGRVEVSQGDVSEIVSQFGLPVSVSGSARMDATIAGTARTGEAIVSLSARNLTADGVAIGILTATGRVALAGGGPITVEAEAPGAGARAHFDIVNRAGYPVSGDIALEHDRINALIPPRFRRQIGDLSGSLSATAKGSGFLSNPSGIRGRVDLRALDVTARGTRVVLAAPGSITLAEDRIALDSVDLRIGQRTRATLDGWLGAAVSPVPLRIRVDSPLAELIDIGSRTAGLTTAPLRTDGTATLDVSVGGTLDHPLPNGSAVLRASSLGYGSLAPMTDVRLEAAIDPAVIALPTLAARWQEASLSGNGTLPWRVVLDTAASSSLAPWLKALPPEPSRATLALRAENVTQAVLKDVVAAERLAVIQGNVGATLTAETDRLSLERVRASAVLDRATLALAGVPLDQRVLTRVRLENGRASIDAFHWGAGTNSIAVTGGADLTTARPSIDAAVTGVLDLRVLNAFADGISSAGTANTDLKVTGPFDNLEVAGRIAVAEGELQLETPRLAASDVTGTLQIAGGRSVAVSLAGQLNTGSTRLEGTIDLQDLAAPRGNLQFTGQGVALEFPSGLQTESNADVRLALAGANSTLSGRVDVLGGTYREALVLSSQLLNLTAANGIARSAPPNDWLSRLRLDIAIATANDILIDNNYGRLDVGATLRVVGTPANPGVLGRLQAADDGEIYLGGNTYRIERLAIDLTSPRGIAPDVDFAAQTRVGDVPIGVELRCPPSGACERKVTSLSNKEDDKEAEARLLGTAGGAAAAGENLARLLSGELLGVVGRSVGLDTVRLEQRADRRDIFDDPTLVSGDVDPAARLTLGKRLGSGVEVVYSQNLADDGFTWITSYTGPRGLSARVLTLDDHSWSYEFRHEPFGGGRTRQRPKQPGPRVSAVRIDGTPGFPENELRGHLRLTEGDRFAFGAWQRDRDRLARFYQEQSFLDARIKARRSDGGDGVLLDYAIRRGPMTRLVVRGATLPDAVRARVARRWTSALFDGFLEKDAKTIVREHLYRKGHLNATVNAAVALDPSADSKTLTIDVVPGPIVPWRIDVTGNNTIPADELLKVLGPDSLLAAWLDPGSVGRLLEDRYRSEGFLAAGVSVGAPKSVDGTSVVTIAISEGPPYSIGEIALSGLPDERRQDARDSLALSTGEPYRPALVAEGVDRVESSLRQLAYRQASADVDTRVDPQAARVDVAVRVTPGPRSILRDVIVEGDNARKAVVARSIVLAPGAPLDPAAILETRRRLYDLEVYRSVDVEIQSLESRPAPVSGASSSDEPVVARITLEPRPRYRLRYGLAVTDERVEPDQRDQQIGFAADLETRNVFGRGATAGASVRLRRNQQVGRLTLGARRLFSLPIRSTVFVERQREQLDPEGAFPITSDISALTVEQGYRITPWIDLRYGYGFEKNHTFIRSDQPDPFDLTVNIARFTTSGLADRRDDAFNPSRGWFAASTIELSTPGLGSDLRFLKEFAQYSHFVPAARGIVVAAAARLGLARTFDDEVLIPSERFYAGGANSVRGYREDSLGAQSALGGAEGGSALVVLNGELRFPIRRRLKGVGFVDAGNVFPAARDIALTSLHVGIGAGVRVDTPLGLIRFDLGVPVNRRSFDPRWRFHVGFGHAF